MKPRKTIRWSKATRDAKKFIQAMRLMKEREAAARQAREQEQAR